MRYTHVLFKSGIKTIFQIYSKGIIKKGRAAGATKEIHQEGKTQPPEYGWVVSGLNPSKQI